MTCPGSEVFVVFAEEQDFVVKLLERLSNCNEALTLEEKTYVLFKVFLHEDVVFLLLGAVAQVIQVNQPVLLRADWPFVRAFGHEGVLDPDENEHRVEEVGYSGDGESAPVLGTFFLSDGLGKSIKHEPRLLLGADTLWKIHNAASFLALAQRSVLRAFDLQDRDHFGVSVGGSLDRC